MPTPRQARRNLLSCVWLRCPIKKVDTRAFPKRGAEERECSYNTHKAGGTAANCQGT